MHSLGKIRVNVLLNDFPVYTEFLVLNNFTQQAILGLAFFHKTKALLNFDLGLISFYSGLIELPFVRQILFHTLAYTISDMELPPFSESLIPIRDKSSYNEARFSGINQLYVVGRSLSDIDSEGMTRCQVANGSNEVVTVYKKKLIAVVSLHLNDNDCVFLTSESGINIQTARVDMNPHEHISNHDLQTQMTSDCSNKSSLSPPPPTAESTNSLSFSHPHFQPTSPPTHPLPLPNDPPPPLPHIPLWRPPPPHPTYSECNNQTSSRPTGTGFFFSQKALQENHVLFVEEFFRKLNAQRVAAILTSRNYLHSPHSNHSFGQPNSFHSAHSPPNRHSHSSQFSSHQ